MLTKLSAIETVKMFAKDCISNGIPLDEVILFGSYSNNTQKLYSDMDVALVSSIFTGFGPEDIEKIAPIMFRMKAYHDIEPHTY